MTSLEPDVRVLLVPNTANAAACDAAIELADWVELRGDTPLLVSDDAEALGLGRFAVSPADIGAPDLVVALGGDGTILKAVHRLGEAESPILGVKFGRLGFLSGARPESMKDALDTALDGHAVIERRATLTAQVHMDGRVVGTYRALNEVVVSRGASGRVIGLKLTVGGTQVSSSHSDGLIVATGTGSTAYALSAGGPIVAPGFGGLVVVPVAVHSLASRPIVTDPGDIVEIELDDPRRADACVIIDGDVTPCRQAVEKVVVTRGQHDVLLVKLEGRDFYQTVAQEFFGG